MLGPEGSYMSSVAPAWAIAATAFPTVSADPVSVADGTRDVAAGAPGGQVGGVHLHHVALVNVQVAHAVGDLLDHIEPGGPTGHFAYRVGTLGRIDEMIRRRPWGTDRQRGPVRRPGLPLRR